MITIDDLKKIELKIASIVKAETVEGSEKLLRLQLDLGDERRQVVSGIAKSYQPDELVGKQVVVVANLEPRTIFGLESQGMLLAAGSDEGPIILSPEKEVVPGSSVA